MMNAWKLAVAWVLAATVGCGGSTFPSSGTAAPPTVAPIATVPVSLTLQQRSTTVVPGTHDKLSLTIDDITGNQVMVTLLGDQQQAIAGPVSLRPGESMKFRFAQRDYSLTLQKLDNALIGEDFATLEIAEGIPGTLTETQKIERLIAHIENLEGATFIRNGSDHTPQEAADHLRRKVATAGDRIETAREFIEHLASKSSTTGTPYTIKLADGSERPAGEFLMEKLVEIETESATATSEADEAAQP